MITENTNSCRLASISSFLKKYWVETVSTIITMPLFVFIIFKGLNLEDVKIPYELFFGILFASIVLGISITKLTVLPFSSVTIFTLYIFNAIIICLYLFFFTNYSVLGICGSAMVCVLLFMLIKNKKTLKSAFPITCLLFLLSVMNIFVFREISDDKMIFYKSKNKIKCNNVLLVPFLQKTSNQYIIVPKILEKEIWTKIKVVYQKDKTNKWEGETKYEGFILVDITPHNYDIYEKVAKFNFSPVYIEANDKDRILDDIKSLISTQLEVEKKDFDLKIKGI